MKLLPVLVFSLIAGASLAQVGGGAAVYGNRGGPLETARQIELAKRVYDPKDTAKYVDASVLMNVEADEYIAIFAVNAEGKTLEEARDAMHSTLAKFESELKAIKVSRSDVSVDFIAQNRIWGYPGAAGDTIHEQVVGFEEKRNVIIHYRDKPFLDQLLSAASKAGVYDLVKSDYIIRDIESVKRKLLVEAAKLLRAKAQAQETLLGVKLGQPTQAMPPQYGVYYPTEMYETYTAQESEAVEGFRSGQTIIRARKPRSFFWSQLTGKDFDAVINPVVTSPLVQCTIYVRLRY